MWNILLFELLCWSGFCQKVTVFKLSPLFGMWNVKSMWVGLHLFLLKGIGELRCLAIVLCCGVGKLFNFLQKSNIEQIFVFEVKHIYVEKNLYHRRRRRSWRGVCIHTEFTTLHVSLGVSIPETCTLWSMHVPLALKRAMQPFWHDAIYMPHTNTHTHAHTETQTLTSKHMPTSLALNFQHLRHLR